MRTTVTLDELEKVFIKIVSDRHGPSMRRIMRDGLRELGKGKYMMEWREAEGIVERNRVIRKKKEENREMRRKKEESIVYD